MASIAYSASTTAVQDDGVISTTPSHQRSTYRTNSTSCDTPANNSLPSPGNRSRSFSISDILSDEMGSRKRSTTNSAFPEPIRKSSKSDHEMVLSPEHATTPSKPFSSHSVTAMLSPVNMYSSLAQQMKGLGDWTPNDSQRTIRQSPYHHSRGYAVSPSTYSNPPTIGSPIVSYPSSYQSIASAYSTQLAAAAQMQQYLQFQAVAAQQQQMMAAAQQENNNNNVIPNTSHKLKQDDHDVMETGNNLENSGIMPYHQATSMPILLKNNRKALKSSTNTDNTNTVPIIVSKSTPEAHHYHYKSQYSRSPLKPPNTTFSPSIFLTRPSNASHTPTNAYSSPAGTDSERNPGLMPNMFMTSTPIRKGEKALFASPHAHSPISATSERKMQLSVEQSWSDGGTDSEVPLLRRPRVPRKRTKPARPTPSQSAYTSPLSENTNPSSRHTPSHPPLPPPSTLLTSYTASVPTGVHQQHNCSNDSGFLSDTNCNVKAPPIPPSVGVTQDHMSATHFGNRSHQQNISSENVFKTPIKSMYTGRQSNNGKYPDAWGSSPFTDHLKKTGRIQSVPPWFVCSDKRSDGKRSRLTEAINKSLMETPTSSTSNQLPAEWQKFAYGQTDDQKDLTQKAITFLRCRPRVLQFEKST